MPRTTTLTVPDFTVVAYRIEGQRAKAWRTVATGRTNGLPQIRVTTPAGRWRVVWISDDGQQSIAA